jgi:CHAT domain-containing protein
VIVPSPSLVLRLLRGPPFPHHPLRPLVATPWNHGPSGEQRRRKPCSFYVQYVSLIPSRRYLRQYPSPNDDLPPCLVIFLSALRTRLVVAPGGLALLCLLSACARNRDGLDGFRAALASSPGVAPRLSPVHQFRPCTERFSPAGTIVVADCPAPRKRNRTRFPTIPSSADDPRSLQLRALSDLVRIDPRGKALDRSITSFRRAVELAGDSAPVLADLAAALIVRAERTQAPRDLLEAYEVAERALSHDSRNPSALYNRALAIDRFGLVDEAVRGWTAYLSADSTSGWAREARRRIARARATARPRQPRLESPLADFAPYAAADPQMARELGMNSLLATWGAAVATGDAARTEAALLRAGALGSALERRPGGDRSLIDAVRAIRRTTANPSRTAALALAHRTYGRAMAAYDSGAFERAAPLLDEAEANAGASPPLRGWARVFRAATSSHLESREVALARLRTTAESIDAFAHPAMAARARWSLGTTLTRDEQWETGLVEMLRSVRLFERAGEAENVGAALNTVLDARFVLGEPDSAYAALHRALARLRPYRASLRLHNLLGSAADQVAIDGLPHAAVLLANEDVRVSGRQPPLFLAEALLRRTRHLATVGELRRARSDFDRAQPVIAALDSSYIAQWYHADVQEAEAITRFGSAPARKAAALDSAAAFFTSISLPFRLLPVLVGAAEARLAAGDPADAARRLEGVMRLLEQRRDSIGVEPRRAAVFDAARHVVDRLVMLELAQSRVDAALGYVDHARASLAASGRATPAGAPHGRPGEVAVEYALIADTLLAWTLVDGHSRLARSVVDTLRLLRTIEGVEGALEAGAGDAKVRPALAQLYEWLVRPMEARLGGAETPLALVVDGSLAAVPFAALYDAHRGRYLGEDHPLRFAVSLAEATRLPPPDSTGGEVLFVADPAFDRRQNPLLDLLASARAEVERSAGAYPGAVVLEGPRADREAVTSAVLRARMVHFAGHAVFDDARPERSYLVLAPSKGDASGRLTAAELARLDLRQVRLVVLSACRTTQTGHSRGAGYSGLSGALLAAGASGTIGSTWDVDDRSTGELMVGFHHALRRGLGPRDALRAAQLALLRSGDPRLRAPAAWAGFRYAGR